jgi:hypothetical protein
MNSHKLAKFLLLLFVLTPHLHAETYRRLHLSTPLLLSGSVGLAFGGNETHQNSIEAEIGIGGGKVLLGRDSFQSGWGFGLKASLLRTWIAPISVDKDQLYFGAELQAGKNSLLGHVGAHRRIEGDDEPWLLSVGVGMRF